MNIGFLTWILDDWTPLKAVHNPPFRSLSLLRSAQILNNSCTLSSNLLNCHPGNLNNFLKLLLAQQRIQTENLLCVFYSIHANSTFIDITSVKVV